MKSATAPAMKPDPPLEAIDTAGNYQAALNEWQAIDGKVSALRHDIQRLETAIQFAAISEIPARSRHIAEELADLIVGCHRSPLRAASDLESLRFDFAEMQPRHAAAHDRYIIARGTEAARIAQTFRERHLAATRSIIAAIEALAEALAGERQVRADFAAASPEPRSCLLPDVSSDLGHCDLARWDGQAAQWARRIRSLGGVTQ